MAAVIDFLDAREIELCLRINRMSRNANASAFFSRVSRLGDGGYWAAIGVALAAGRGTEGLIADAQIFCTAAFGVLLYKILKQKFVRERPFVAHAAIECGTAPLDRYSFPSGHTLHAVSFTILFTSAEPVLFVFAAPFAVLVAVSRVVLGLHYPSDVLAGAAVGALIATSSLAVSG